MSLLEKDPNAPDAWLGEMPVTSRYTLTVGGLELETQKGTGTMARAVQMARFTATLE